MPPPPVPPADIEATRAKLAELRGRMTRRTAWAAAGEDWSVAVRNAPWQVRVRRWRPLSSPGYCLPPSPMPSGSRRALETYGRLQTSFIMLIIALTIM